MSLGRSFDIPHSTDQELRMTQMEKTLHPLTGLMWNKVWNKVWTRKHVCGAVLSRGKIWALALRQVQIQYLLLIY